MEKKTVLTETDWLSLKGMPPSTPSTIHIHDENETVPMTLIVKFSPTNEPSEQVSFHFESEAKPIFF